MCIFARRKSLFLYHAILFSHFTILDDLFVFRKFHLDESPAYLDDCRAAAVEKLQTLFPGKRITVYDDVTLGIETDSLYSETGIDIYELGLVDDELPAMRNTSNDNVTTFRI